MVEYTPETLLAQYIATKEYQQKRKNVKKGVALPSDVSEAIVRFAIIGLGDKTCRPAKRGDLVSDLEGVIQVKCFTSDGPTSFGSDTYWDVIYFLDARDWIESDRFRLYRVGVASVDDRWRDLRFTQTKTFGKMIERSSDEQIPVRPRCSFERIHQQLGDETCRLVFDGTLDEILSMRPDFSPPGDGLRVVDLFAGTGAFSLAFRETGCAPVFANDLNEASKRIYELNLDHELTLGDLNDIPVNEIPSHDILTGGFPCQPFSIAGRQLGFDDTRANIFFKIIEIIRHHRPKCVLLENVKNILRHDPYPKGEETDVQTSDVLKRSSGLSKKFGKTITTVTRLLEQEGYHLHLHLINTADTTGIPQHRERMYLVGFQEKECFDAYDTVFEPVEKRPLSEFLDIGVSPDYYYTKDKYKEEIVDSVVNFVAREDTLYQYRRTIVRENKSMECPTLTANMGGGGHNVPLLRDQGGVRKLTPRECFRLQGFPETYRLSRALCDGAHYRLAGNAVSFPVVLSIARRITKCLVR